jgi:hypothetical protein
MGARVPTGVAATMDDKNYVVVVRTQVRRTRVPTASTRAGRPGVAARRDVYRLRRELRDASDAARVVALAAGRTEAVLENSGILGALESERELVFRHYSASAFPTEDIELLRDGKYSEDEIQLFLFAIPEKAPVVVTSCPRVFLNDARQQVINVVNVFQAPHPEPKKKRKVLIGLAQISVARSPELEMRLLAAGTIAAPNPATAAAVIGSGAGAATLIHPNTRWLWLSPRRMKEPTRDTLMRCLVRAGMPTRVTRHCCRTKYGIATLRPGRLPEPREER